MCPPSSVPDKRVSGPPQPRRPVMTCAFQRWTVVVLFRFQSPFSLGQTPPVAPPFSPSSSSGSAPPDSHDGHRGPTIRTGGCAPFPPTLSHAEIEPGVSPQLFPKQAKHSPLGHRGLWNSHRQVGTYFCNSPRLSPMTAIYFFFLPGVSSQGRSYFRGVLNFADPDIF